MDLPFAKLCHTAVQVPPALPPCSKCSQGIKADTLSSVWSNVKTCTQMFGDKAGHDFALIITIQANKDSLKACAKHLPS